jgi:hypothetical protein
MAKKKGTDLTPLWWILGGVVAVGAVVTIGGAIWFTSTADKMMNRGMSPSPFPSGISPTLAAQMQLQK